MEETAYRQFIELEERHFWFIGRRRIFGHLLDRLLAGRSGLRILDVGCGAGGMLELLSRYGEVTGIDTSQELIDVCRDRGFGRTSVASADDPPVRPGSIDLVTMFDTLEHLPDDVGVLVRLRQALAPDGLLFASVPAYQFLYANNDRIAHHERRYTRRRLRERLVSAGYEPLKLTYFNTLLFPVILPVVLAKKARERVSGPDDTTNLSHEVPPALNRLLAATMASERRPLAQVSFPFGHSIIAIARNAG